MKKMVIACIVIVCVMAGCLTCMNRNDREYRKWAAELTPTDRQYIQTTRQELSTVKHADLLVKKNGQVSYVIQGAELSKDGHSWKQLIYKNSTSIVFNDATRRTDFGDDEIFALAKVVKRGSSDYGKYLDRYVNEQ